MVILVDKKSNEIREGIYHYPVKHVPSLDVGECATFYRVFKKGDSFYYLPLLPQRPEDKRVYELLPTIASRCTPVSKEYVEKEIARIRARCSSERGISLHLANLQALAS